MGAEATAATPNKGKTTATHSPEDVGDDEKGRVEGQKLDDDGVHVLNVFLQVAQKFGELEQPDQLEKAEQAEDAEETEDPGVA